MPTKEKPESAYYADLHEFNKQISSLKVPDDWQISNKQKHIFQKNKSYKISSVDIYVVQDFEFIICVFSWSIPLEHEIYTKYKRAMKNAPFLTSFNICSVIKDEQAKKPAICHSVPKTFDFSQNSSVPFHQVTFYRSISCVLLIDKPNESCRNCIKFERNSLSTTKKLLKRKEKNITPAKRNAAISQTSSKRLKITIQTYRMENKELKIKLGQLQEEISKASLAVSADLSNDFKSIILETEQRKILPFMKLFWEEQQKYLQSSPNNVKYHPMIIRYGLSLASKSAAVYDDIHYDEKTGTGFVILPSRRHLRDYKNCIRPHQGFNKDIANELLEKVKNFSDNENFFVMLMDEIKIQENHVWDKHTGDIIGYVDFGDAELNYATLQKSTDIATHVLVFLLRSAVNPLKFSLANFATTGATSSQMFPLLWKAISICELNSLKVLAVTCDGASPTHKLFHMHFPMTKEDDMNSDTDVTYRTVNLFSSDNRFIYVISDVPHLMKTARNCLYNSGKGRYTRYMWKNGMFILWNHISDIFYEDRECDLYILPKLTNENIKLTPYSKMNVRPAA